MEAIVIKNLTKKYKDIKAVDDLSLTINKGELFALLGVNGAGKTTTIKMLSTLTSITSGEAYVMGKSVKSEAYEVKKLIAVSPQETAVAPLLTARENLELIANIHGFKKEDCKNKVNSIIELLDLHEVEKRKAGKLSGGWQRRLSIAMALISDPQVLFLDEPTLGLDVIARSELWDVINSLKGKITIILTTHYMEEAESLSDRVAIMKSGKLLICDKPQKIITKSGEENFEKAFIKIIKEGEWK